MAMLAVWTMSFMGRLRFDMSLSMTMWEMSLWMEYMMASKVWMALERPISFHCLWSFMKVSTGLRIALIGRKET